jgi:hypothetical protein
MAKTTKLEAHPVAALFPMLTEAELEDMAADIRERGQLQPIMIRDGLILDGRNRYRACEIAGVDPITEEYTGDDPEGYALAVNLARRNLSKGQAAIIATDPKIYSVNFGGGKRLAALLDVSPATISQARGVWSYPDLAESVRSGEETLACARDERVRRDTRAKAMTEQQAKLAQAAPDLAERVDDERDSLTLGEALAILESRRSDAERQAHEDSVTRARDIDSARRAADSIIPTVQSAVASILIGRQLGGTDLIGAAELAKLRETIDQLES